MGTCFLPSITDALVINAPAGKAIFSDGTFVIKGSDVPEGRFISPAKDAVADEDISVEICPSEMDWHENIKNSKL